MDDSHATKEARLPAEDNLERLQAAYLEGSSLIHVLGSYSVIQDAMG